MKEFKSLLDAFNYQSKCPVCTGPVKLSAHDDARLIRSKSRGPKDTIIWSSYNISSDSDTEIVINLATSQVERFKIACSNHHGYMTMVGDMYIRARLACVKCNGYCYVIQIRLNIEQSKVMAILLNSETISIEDPDRDMTHEIINVYATEKTEYYTYTPALRNERYNGREDYDDKSITLPLIPLNLLNPEKTIERIRTLILFS